MIAVKLKNAAYKLAYLARTGGGRPYTTDICVMGRYQALQVSSVWEDGIARERQLPNYENATDDLLRHALATQPHRSHFVDVGANVGLYSVAASLRNFRVSAIEPHPQNADALSVNAQINDADNIRIYRAIAGECIGTTTFHVGAPGTGFQINGVSEMHLRSLGLAPEPLRLPERPLDHLLHRSPHGPPRVIKIDVEGAEMRVLRGAYALLAEHHPILIVEAHPDAYPYYQLGPQTLRTWIESFGYEVRLVGDPTQRHHIYAVHHG